MENIKSDPIDYIKMDVPLFIRMLEYAKEDAKTDMDLHSATEKAVELTKKHGKLSMKSYSKICGVKQEPKECTDSGSSGAFESPAFGQPIKRSMNGRTEDVDENKKKGKTDDELKKVIRKGADVSNFGDPVDWQKKTREDRNKKMTDNKPKEQDIDEVTGSGSATGAFDVPAFGKNTKGGRPDPLALGGEKTIKQSRAVTDKNFPKYGGPGGKFVEINPACKTFPYCNQGEKRAVRFYESQELRDVVLEVSSETGIPYKDAEKIVLNEIKRIFM
jgi:hypothetical protein